jgi:hypothetical protein
MHEFFDQFEGARALTDPCQERFPGWMRRLDFHCFAIDTNAVAASVGDPFASFQTFLKVCFFDFKGLFDLHW